MVQGDGKRIEKYDSDGGFYELRPTEVGSYIFIKIGDRKNTDYYLEVMEFEKFHYLMMKFFIIDKNDKIHQEESVC